MTAFLWYYVSDENIAHLLDIAVYGCCRNSYSGLKAEELGAGVKCLEIEAGGEVVELRGAEVALAACLEEGLGDVSAWGDEIEGCAVETEYGVVCGHGGKGVVGGGSAGTFGLEEQEVSVAGGEDRVEVVSVSVACDGLPDRSGPEKSAFGADAGEEYAVAVEGACGGAFVVGVGAGGEALECEDSAPGGVAGGDDAEVTEAGLGNFQWAVAEDFFLEVGKDECVEGDETEASGIGCEGIDPVGEPSPCGGFVGLCGAGYEEVS